MVDAGIATPDAVLELFKGIQMQNKYHWVIYKIENKRQIAEAGKLETDDNDWDWDNFCDALTESKEPRFATVDFHYLSKDGIDKTKLLFVSWTPEESRPGDKMLYASTKEGFKAKLDGVQKVLQATDDDDLDHSHVQAVVEAL